MRHFLILAVTSAVLTACGGGGDAGSSTPTTYNSTALSSSNYVDVSKQAMATTFSLANNAGLLTGAQVSDSSDLIAFSKAQLPKMAGWFASTPAVLTGATQVETEQCTGGGNLSVTITDLNGNQRLDSGDSAAITASNCVVSGTTINGQLSVVYNSITGNLDAYPYSFSATVTLNNLTTRSAQITTQGTGSFTLAVSGTSNSSSTVSLTASSLSTASTYAGATYSATLTNYIIAETLGATSSTTLVSGSLNTSQLGSNTLTTATITPFTRFYTNAYPSSGQVTVAASQGGKVRLTVQSASTVLIELDANGDDKYEVSVTRLWSDMV